MSESRNLPTSLAPIRGIQEADFPDEDVPTLTKTLGRSGLEIARAAKDLKVDDVFQKTNKLTLDLCTTSEAIQAITLGDSQLRIGDCVKHIAQTAKYITRAFDLNPEQAVQSQRLVTAACIFMAEMLYEEPSRSYSIFVSTMPDLVYLVILDNMKVPLTLNERRACIKQQRALININATDPSADNENLKRETLDPTNGACNHQINSSEIENAVDRVQIKEPVYRGHSDNRLLCEFKQFIKTLLTKRSWTVAHEYFLLLRMIDTQLYLSLNIPPLTDRRIGNYSYIVSTMWDELSRSVGGSAERDKVVAEILNLRQGRMETPSQFLDRLVHYKYKSELVGESHQDSFWIGLAKAGVRNRELLIALAQCDSTNFNEWAGRLRQFEGISTRMNHFQDGAGHVGFRADRPNQSPRTDGPPTGSYRATESPATGTTNPMPNRSQEDARRSQKPFVNSIGFRQARNVNRPLPKPVLRAIVGGTSVDVLLDTGSSINIISETQATKLKLDSTQVQPVDISSEIGGSRTTSFEAELPLTILDHRVSVDCMVIPGESPVILLGTRTIVGLAQLVGWNNLWPTLEDARSELGERIALEMKPVTMDLHSNHIELEEEIIRELEANDDICDNDLNELLMTRGESSNIFAKSIPGRELRCIDDIVKHGRFPVDNAPGYTLELEECNNGDLEKQTHQFTLNWGVCKTPPPFPRVNFGRNLLARLSEDAQQQWHKELEEYENKNWWRSPSSIDPERTPCIGTVVAFPRVQQPTKVRPVLDCTGINRMMPLASSHKSSTQAAIFRLRSHVRRGMMVVQFDLQRAFYKIKLKDMHIRVLAGDNCYTTNRMAFGLAPGTAALDTCLSLLISMVNHSYDINERPLVVRHVDDVIIAGMPGTVVPFREELLAVLERCGFNAPAEKSATWGSETPTKWMGLHWTWDSDSGEISYERKPVTLATPTLLSKREVFIEAGKVLDCTRTFDEARARLHCDLAKRLAGQFDGWKRSDKLPEQTSRECARHLSIAFNCISRDQRGRQRPLDALGRWHATCDASNSAYGFVLLRDNQPWYATGRLFPLQSQFWHCNRRELFALSTTLQHILLLIRRNEIQITLLVIQSDSRTALSAGKETSTKAVEWIAIQRLRGVIRDAIHEFGLMGVRVDLEHISGEQNVFSDVLSRPHQDKGESVVPPNISTVNAITLTDNQALPTPGATSIVDNEWLIRTQELSPLISEWQLFMNAPSEGGPWTATNKKRLKTETRHLVIDNGIIYKKWYKHGIITGRASLVVVVPTDTAVGAEMVDRLIVEMHDKLGHLNHRMVRYHLSRSIWFPKMQSRIKAKIRSCVECQNSPPFSPSPLHIDSTDQATWTSISIDLAGPLVRLKMPYIMLVVCHASKFTVIRPLTDAKAVTCANLLRNIFNEYGTPKQLQADNQPFSSKAFKQSLLEMGVITKNVAPVSPQSNGLVERMVREAKRVLTLTNPKTDPSTKMMQRLNNRVLADTTTPFQIMFGRDPRLVSIGNNPSAPMVNRSEELEEYRQHLEMREPDEGRIRRRRMPSLGDRIMVIRSGKVCHVRGIRGSTLILDDDSEESARNCRHYYAEA